MRTLPITVYCVVHLFYLSLKIINGHQVILHARALGLTRHHKLATRIDMAVTHGSVGEYDNAVKDWKTYVERVDLYLMANEITDAVKKRAVLLSLCGTKMYHTIRDLVAPTKPTEITYDDTVSQVQKYFNPKLVVMDQHFKFNSRSHQAVATLVVVRNRDRVG